MRVVVVSERSVSYNIPMSEDVGYFALRQALVGAGLEPQVDLHERCDTHRSTRREVPASGRRT